MIRVFGKTTIQVSLNVRYTLLMRPYNQQFLTSSSGSSTSGSQITNVPGLSKKCVDMPDTPVGPRASKSGEYKNAEYFCYNEMSFAEAEVEMAKFRLPAPSNKKKPSK
ncbi:uncharacterized protein LOC105690067 isoform X1 [Athalia rosae]|uniref:uncharacterized protein LOC105690067 isoform X1 n=1 Tax=Athalia rosae TaxID=37344 RepID=UPI002033760E|nr:uncharacterized protein LOC105690067 isoform X1 [Athalia rosae]